MNDSELADVVVIGSGAAGAALTKRLSDRGAKVICLEQGRLAKSRRLSLERNRLRGTISEVET